MVFSGICSFGVSRTSEPDGTGTAVVPGDGVTEGTSPGLAAGVAVAAGGLVVPGSWTVAVADGSGAAVAEGSVPAWPESVVNALIHILFKPFDEASSHFLLR